MISFGYTYFRNVLLAIFCTSLALFVQCRYECTAANVITVQLSQILEITIVWDLMLFTNVSEETTVSICLSSSTMKMEALISSRMSVNSFQTTWNYITDDINLRGHCCSPWSTSYIWKCSRYKIFCLEEKFVSFTMKWILVWCSVFLKSLWFDIVIRYVLYCNKLNQQVLHQATFNVNGQYHI